MTNSVSFLRAAGAFRKLVSTPILLLASFLVPRDESIWVFTAENANSFSENSKYMYLHCQREGIRNVWIGDSASLVDELERDGYEAYTAQSWKGRLLLLRCGVVFRTHGINYWRYVSGATIVNLWHGNALKLMGEDKGQTSVTERVQRGIGQFLTSYTLVTNTGTPLKTFQSAMNIDPGDTIVAPYPRLDILLEEYRGTEIGTNQANLDSLSKAAEDSTIIMYLPTWRRAFGEKNGLPLHEIKPDFEELDRVLMEKNAILYISTHPHEEVHINYEDRKNITELDTGGDVYPFLKHSDFLITDYSSIFYDFLVADNPMIFFAPDLKEYRQDRGFYFEYEDHVPGPVSKTTEQLTQQITHVLEGRDEFGEERQRLKDEYYGSGDGKPSRLVYKELVEELELDRTRLDT